jgi:hypothetical protein
LNDFIATKLDATNVVFKLLVLEIKASLAKEWNNRYTAVSTDDCDVLLGRVGIFDLTDKSAGTDNVEGGDTEEFLRIVDTM